MRIKRWTALMAGGALALALLLGLGARAAEASHTADPKKHKAFFHLTESDPAKASAVLTNIQNFVEVLGWGNIEALELVVHGPGLRPFIAKGIDPEVKAKVEALLTGGMRMGACEITMRRQGIKREELIEGLTPIPSGVVRVMELEEQGFAYIRP
jgi:intracellular sulfur oxidation DsrE/DsrF family protein